MSMLGQGKKVLQVTEALGGGVLWSVSQTCNGLVRAGWEVHLAYSRRDETPAELSKFFDSRVVLHPVNMVRSISPATDLKSVREMVALLESLKPDVIHLHSSKAGVVGRFAAKWLGKIDSTVYSPRGLAFLREDVSRTSRFIYLLAEWVAAKLGGTVLACSQGELDVVQHRLHPAYGELVENAIEVDAVRAKDWSTSKARPLVGTSGRLSFQKNPSAFAGLAKAIGDGKVDWTWIGGGDEAWRKELSDAGVTVTGWLHNEKAREILPEMDVYVQTSLWEGMPISVIEAQVCGIPAVVTDVVGNRDVVRHGVTGFIAKSAEELVQFTNKLIDDPELQKAMGNNARSEAYSRFSLDRMTAELDGLYQRIVARVK